MATRLKAIIRFAAVPPGVPTALPHGLNIDARAVTPDCGYLSAEDFVAVADATSVTVTNNGPAAASVDALVEVWHTFERDFGADATIALIPRPIFFGPGTAPLFGNDYQVATNPNRLTTTGAAFQTHLQLVTPGLTGTYRVMGTAFVDSALAMRCRLENVTDAAVIQDTAIVQPGVAAARVPVLFVGDVVFAGAAKTFELRFSDQPPPGNVAGMEASRIELWRVA